MKRFMLFAMIIIMAMSLRAQTAQVATLLHEGNLKMFYSASALVDAYAEAVDGDVITLSSGQFTAVDLKKNITVRGAGMGVFEELGNQLPTILLGDFSISVAATEKHHLTLEGLEHNSKIAMENTSNVQMVKCHFMEIARPGKLEAKYICKNLTVLHCWIETLDLPYNYSSLKELDCQINLVNSVIGQIPWPMYTKSGISIVFDNCIIVNKDAGLTTGEIKYCNLHNCLIYSIVDESKKYFGNLSKAYNCVWIGASAKQPFAYASTYGNNHKIENFAAASPFKDDKFFQLIDELKEYKGLDGKEIGIYGGQFPFTPFTSYLQIVKFNVAPRTTADGKLSVDIEIKMNE